MGVVEALNRMFNASSVAVIGASSEQGKVGYSVVKNMVDGGYKGKIYPVNPSRVGEVLFGLRYYANVREIPDVVDTAVIVIPARFVNEAIADCGRKGIPTAVIISSGYSETGNVDLQRQLVEAGRKAQVRILGPNIFGFYYTHNDLCATFCTPYTKRGGIALTCQSGGVGMAIIGFTRSRGMGVSAIVGLGNKADLDEDDMLEFFGQDDNTKVIAMHMEDLKDGRAFVNAARRVSKAKPIVVFKAGRTQMGARAAASHTGALAGVDHIYDAAFKKCGVIRAHTLYELLDWARALFMLPPPRGENVFIHTSAGGLGVILADAAQDYGLKPMDIPSDLERELRRYIPPFGSFKNPVDVTGSSTPEIQGETAEIAIRDPRVHSIIFGYWHTVITPPMVYAKVLAEAVEGARAEGIEKPMVASLSGDVEVEEAARYLEGRGIPSYPYMPERAVSSLAAVYRWARYAGLVEHKSSRGLRGSPTKEAS
ncbi:MAG: acetate--CoA ligase family protein [Candidatus Geothermarchaeales archaeon]